MTRCLLCQRLIPRGSYCSTCRRMNNSMRGGGRQRQAVRAEMFSGTTRCMKCGTLLTYQTGDVGHIRAVRDFPPGTHPAVINAPSNLQPECIPCNRGQR